MGGRYTDSFNSERLCLHSEASVSEDLSSVASYAMRLRPQQNAGISPVVEIHGFEPRTS